MARTQIDFEVNRVEFEGRTTRLDSFGEQPYLKDIVTMNFISAMKLGKFVFFVIIFLTFVMDFEKAMMVTTIMIIFQMKKTNFT